MDIAEIALALFTASVLTYSTVRSYRLNRAPKLKREIPVDLWLLSDRQPEDTEWCVVLVFDKRGYLVRKFPQAECIYRKDRYRIQCAATPDECSFCVLFSTAALNLSGILRQEDVRSLSGYAGGGNRRNAGDLPPNNLRAATGEPPPSPRTAV